MQSVERLLSAGNGVSDAAYVWIRHRHMVPYTVVSFLAVLLGAALAGVEAWSTRIGLGVAAAAVAVTASTKYRVVAKTSKGVTLLRASRIRQHALEVIETTAPPVEIVPVADTLLATEWRVASIVYTVPKSSEAAIRRIAADVSPI